MSTLNKAIRLAYENPALRLALLPMIKEAMEFATDKEMETYLEAHPKADPKKHKVVEHSLEKANKGMAEKAKSLSSKAKKALTSMFSSGGEAVRDFLGNSEKRKEMLTTSATAVKDYVKNSVVGEDSEGNLSLKKGAIGKSIGEEIHHVKDFSKGTSTLIKSALGGEVSDEEKKEAKHQLAHSAWGMSVLAGKVIMAGAAASASIGTGGAAPFLAYAGKKFGMKLGIHLAIASMTRSGGFANAVGTGQMAMAGGDALMDMFASDEEGDSYSAKYGKKAKSDEDKSTLLVLDLVGDMAEDMKNLSEDDILKLVEETATGSDEEKLSDDQVDKIIEGLTKSLKAKAKAPKKDKKASYAELDISF